MQFTLGTISILQITLIPGVMLLLFKKPKVSLFEYLILAFILSLSVNIIIGLAFLNPYVRENINIKTIILVEIMIIGVLSIKNRKILLKVINIDNKLDKSFIVLINILILFYFSLMIINFDKPISMQDTKTYISFAKSFYNSILPDPNVAFGYPQALSVLWSISFRITQNSELEMFIKSLLYIFPMIANLAFIELYKIKLKTHYLLGAFFFNLLILIYFNGYIGSGMREVELACLVVLLYFFMQKYIFLRKVEYLFLTSLTGALAANIKQSGLIILVLMFLFLSYTLVRKKIGLIIYILNLLVLLIGLAWFMYHNYLVYFGFSSSESTYLTIGIHESRNFLLRIPYAISKFFFGSSFTILSPGIIAIGISIFILYIFSIFITKDYAIYLLSVLFFVHWAFYFSYDLRNLGLIFPIVSILAAQTFLKIFNVNTKKVGVYYEKVFKLKLFYLSAAGFCFIILFGQNYYTNSKLNEISIYNQELYDEPDRTKLLVSKLQLNQSRILATHFSGISKIEALSPYIIILPLEISGSRLEYLIFENKIKYLYLRKVNGLSLGARDLINNLNSQGRNTLLSEDKEYYLYEVRY
jgi:hypothetical protein